MYTNAIVTIAYLYGIEPVFSVPTQFRTAWADRSERAPRLDVNYLMLKTNSKVFLLNSVVVSSNYLFVIFHDANVSEDSSVNARFHCSLEERLKGNSRLETS